jgi:hypothetical protein
MDKVKRSEILRKQRKNHKSEVGKESLKVPQEWPLPKEERPGNYTAEEDVELTPHEFSLNLVGGRGGKGQQVVDFSNK